MNPLRESILEQLIEDWLPASGVSDAIELRTDIHDPAVLRMLALGFIAEECAADRIEIGDYTDDDGFAPRIGTLQDILNGLARVWPSDRRPHLYEVAWFNITPAGERLYEEIKSRSDRE